MSVVRAHTGAIIDRKPVGAAPVGSFAAAWRGAGVLRTPAKAMTSRRRAKAP